MRFLAITMACFLSTAFTVLAGQDSEKSLFITAPDALVETGIFQYILPRFKLKTQVQVTLVPRGADVDFGTLGQKPVLQQGAVIYGIDLKNPSAAALRFDAWLHSDVGHKTILSYVRDGQVVFTIPDQESAAPQVQEVTGNRAMGLAQSRSKCARCHVVEKGAMNSIGSTPSFFVLRGFEDWQVRFSGFYALNPHPAFTVIEDVTEPFDISRPAPIVPIELTVEELEAIIAYTQSLPAADLGAPLKHQ